VRRLSGTDGIRGVAGQYPLDPPTIEKIGAAITLSLKKEHPNPSILIGRDTRESGPSIEQSLINGILGSQGRVALGGVLPTPAIAYLTKRRGFDAGIAISASHNPYQDNGIKVFSCDGYKISDDMEEEIEALVLDRDFVPTMPQNRTPYNLVDESLINDYKDFLLGIPAPALSLKGMKVVLDCAQGATYCIAPSVFARLGAEVHPLFFEPNGRNINQSCGSLYPQRLASEVQRLGADLGVAFDGDGDRAIFVDRKGRILDGDYILMVCSRYLKSRGKLPRNAVVSTVMSNLGLKKALQQEDIALLTTNVGDKYVLSTMLQEGINLGGEQSGHIIFADHATTGDGILTAIKVLEIICHLRQDLSILADGMAKYPQVLINIPVATKPPWEKLPDVAANISEIEGLLGERGRVVVRYSGTEPLARVMIEGEDQQTIQLYAEEIAKAIKRTIGAAKKSQP